MGKQSYDIARKAKLALCISARERTRTLMLFFSIFTTMISILISHFRES